MNYNQKSKFFVVVLLTTFLITVYMSLKSMNPIQHEERFLDLDYGKIWYQRWFNQKTKDKTPVLFMHGGPGFESGAMVNLNPIAAIRPCIFYDQSGCGKSIIPKNTRVEWSFEHYERELETIIDKLGINKIILFGYSWGAALAVQYALQHPERVEKLVLASPYISTPHLLENYTLLAQSKNMYDIIKKHEEEGTIESAEYQEAYAIFFKSFIFRGDVSVFKNLTFNKEISEIMWGKNEFSVTGNLKNLNLIPLLHELKLPVLLTSGKFDTMTPSYMVLLHTQIHNSKLVIFEHSAHMPHIEEFTAYCQEVEKFLSD